MNATTDRQAVTVEFNQVAAPKEVIIHNVRDWKRQNKARASELERKHHSISKARQIACERGLLASMEDALNKIPVRARA